jgi:hypothetical protein
MNEMIVLNKKIRLDLIQSDILDYDDILTIHIDSILQNTLGEILKKVQNKKFKIEPVDAQKFLWFTVSEGFLLASVDHLLCKIFTQHIYPQIVDKYTEEQIKGIREYYNNNKLTYLTDMAKTLEVYLGMYIDNKFIDITFCQNTFRRTDTLRFDISIGFKQND